MTQDNQPDGRERVVTVGGQDWADVVAAARESAVAGERIVVNMGPQHPSTHGVLRLILEIDGETITEARCGIGYLHTGIEKNLEYRTWTQGVTFVTRMDYLSPFFNETAYCLGVEKLLGVSDDIPERASAIRVLMMELTRISSHLICLGTGGMEMGATTIMTISFRERERILSVIENITGLRMNNAYIRPGGVAQDLPHGAIDKIREMVPQVRKGIGELEQLLLELLGHVDHGDAELGGPLDQVFGGRRGGVRARLRAGQADGRGEPHAGAGGQVLHLALAQHDHPRREEGDAGGRRLHQPDRVHADRVWTVAEELDDVDRDQGEARRLFLGGRLSRERGGGRRPGTGGLPRGDALGLAGLAFCLAAVQIRLSGHLRPQVSGQ